MAFKYNANADSAYIKFTENEIAKTEAMVENIYVDLDEHGRPVVVEISGKARSIGNKMAHSLQNMKTCGLRDFAIQEYLKDLRIRFG